MKKFKLTDNDLDILWQDGETTTPRSDLMSQEQKKRIAPYKVRAKIALDKNNDSVLFLKESDSARVQEELVDELLKNDQWLSIKASQLYFENLEKQAGKEGGHENPNPDDIYIDRLKAVINFMTNPRRIKIFEYSDFEHDVNNFKDINNKEAFEKWGKYDYESARRLFSNMNMNYSEDLRKRFLSTISED